MKGEFYKMDFRAWNVGTVDLTLEQEAAYLRLCHAMYDVRGPVPNSTRFLQSIFRCGNTKATTLVSQLIQAGKIAVTSDGRLINHRVTEELEAREKVSSVRRVAGERGGSASRATAERPPSEPRANSDRPPSDGQATARKSLENNEQSEAIASTLGSREEKSREEQSNVTSLRSVTTAKVRKHAWPNDYREQSWDRYGKKVDKQPSMAALDALYRADRTPWTEFIDGVDRQAGAVAPQYRPSLERFIKRQKWTDQYPQRDQRNGSGSDDLFPGHAARPRHGGSSYDAVVTGMADVASRRGIGSRGRQDGSGYENGRDHRSRPDDPEIEDALWTPAGGYRAAHH